MINILSILFLLTVSGCAARSSYNIIDVTDEQFIEDKDGNRCHEAQMIIDVDQIIYFYSNCPIRRIVKPKPHVLPKP